MSKLRSIFGWKCPRCGHGDLYKTSFVEGIYNMHQECPKCKQDFEMEPGFYWGAMYIGYGLSAGYMLAGFAVCLWLFKFTINQSFLFLIATLIVMVPIIARTARAMWISGNVSFDKEISEKIAAEEQEKNKK